MPLMCDLGWHRADPMARWNNGYYFSKCTRCRRDLVRTAYAGWHVPRGYKVVWQTKAPDHRKAAAPVHEPLIAMPAISVGTRGAASDAELPIQAVLRHLNARDLSNDPGVGYADHADEPAPAAGEDPTPVLADAKEIAVKPVAAEEIEVDQVEIAEVQVSRLGEPDFGAGDQVDDVAPVAEQVDSETFESAEEAVEQPGPPHEAAVPDTDQQEPNAEAEEETPVMDSAPPLEERHDPEPAEAATVEDQPLEEPEPPVITDDAAPAEETEQQDEDAAPADEELGIIEDAAEPPAEEPASRISFDDFMEDDSDLINWDDAPPRRFVIAPAPAPEIAEPEEAGDAAVTADADGSSHEATAPEAPQFEWLSQDDTAAPREEVEVSTPPETPAEEDSSDRPQESSTLTEAETAPRKTISFGGQVAVTGALMAGVLMLVAAVADRPQAEPLAAAPQSMSNSAAQVMGAPPQGDQMAEARKTGFVTARILNCRASPVAQASSVRKLPRGATVEILAREAEWVSLSHRGRQCWAAARFISTDRPA